MADINGNTLLMDWYNTYVAPKKEPIEGVFSRKSPDLGLGLPTSPTPVPSAPAVAIPPTMPETPANPVDSYTPQPISEPTTEAAPTAPATKDSGGISPGAMGLLGFGLSMAATPPRAVPYTGAEIVGNAGLHGLAFYEKALEDKRKQQALDVSTEEHRLSREDRRQANEDRAQYYRDQAETKKMNAESLAQSRVVNEAYRKQLEANAALLSAPVPDAVWDANGHPEMKGKGITGNQFKEYGMAAWTKGPGMAVVTNDKGDVTITPKVPGVLPGAGKSKTQPAGAGGEGPGKTAAIALINKEVVSQYLPIARDEISKNAPPGSEKMRQMVESLNTQDPTTGGPNEAKVREHLSPKQREELDFVKRKAQEYSKTMVPAVAVQKARDDWNKDHPAPKVDARYEEYRRVYEEIRNYPGWSNAEKNAKIREMNEKARGMGLIK